MRTVIGAFILTELTTILSGMGFGQGDTYILFGVAIVVVVLAYGRQRRLNDRVLEGRIMTTQIDHWR